MRCLQCGEVMYEKLDVFDCVQLLTVPGVIMYEKLGVYDCVVLLIYYQHLSQFIPVLCLSIEQFEN